MREDLTHYDDDAEICDDEGNVVAMLSPHTDAPTARAMAGGPRMLKALRDLIRYDADDEWRREQEDRAAAETDGNVSFHSALIGSAREAVRYAEGEC
jgi:hypothetical protein